MCGLNTLELGALLPASLHTRLPSLSARVGTTERNRSSKRSEDRPVELEHGPEKLECPTNSIAAL